ncbi:amidophosphoribosyltransferase [Erysipelothrix larvae]|uniref:Amidophosphoribosyltransferase n=1 Tax=Erysipelothrix larvae TaxID=1514105 RepID=A0A0X8H0M2_9FIRM|nr:amidophosphoribosyltransferase [Erysipelothrix larvae]AMC93877.1 amidophosphoribosyltransferase [Erysipelothrix larvae]
MVNTQFDDRSLHEECGVFGIYNVQEAAQLSFYGLHSMQHRGQEGTGIVTSDSENLYGHKNEGQVRYVFNDANLSKLKGDKAIGHVRYATQGGSGLMNVQPFLFKHSTGDFGLCHNGNIVNSSQLREFLESKGSIFQSTSDTEIFAHLIKQGRQTNFLDAIKESLLYLEGAFAFLLLTKDTLYAMRDKNGLRPLSIGQLDNGYVVSSETCALDMIGATFTRDILPGEVVMINQEGIHSSFYAKDVQHRMCAMEYIYFSRPDSDITGLNVHTARKQCGRMLAQEAPVEADIVVGVPDSSLSAAYGYAEESGIPYEMGMIKNRYSGRTFIEPTQAMREKGVKMKLSPVRSVVSGKRVILIDDSIVRGTTSANLVAMLKQMGALEVHMRIASPPIIAPCFYGVDTSTYDELISANMGLDELCEKIGADSLYFLSEAGLQKALNNKGLCMACFNKNYPTELYSKLEEANKDGKC